MFGEVRMRNILSPEKYAELSEDEQFFYDLLYKEHGSIDKIIIPKYIQDGAFNTVFGPLERWRGVLLEVKEQ